MSKSKITHIFTETLTFVLSFGEQKRYVGLQSKMRGSILLVDGVVRQKTCVIGYAANVNRSECRKKYLVIEIPPSKSFSVHNTQKLLFSRSLFAVCIYVLVGPCNLDFHLTFCGIISIF